MKMSDLLQQDKKNEGILNMFWDWCLETYHKYPTVVWWVVLFILFLFVFGIARTVYIHRKLKLHRSNFRSVFWDNLYSEEQMNKTEELYDLFKKSSKIGRGAKFESLYVEVASLVDAGMADNVICKMLPIPMSNIDIMPFISTVRACRSMVAAKMLKKGDKKQKEYTQAWNYLLKGEPKRMLKLLEKELYKKQKMVWATREKMVLDYIRKEASNTAFHLGVLAGFFDARLANRAFTRAMELSPDIEKTLIFGRFRVRTMGNNDQLSTALFKSIAQQARQNMQKYMLDYMEKVQHDIEIRQRQDEIRQRIKDRRERYMEAISIERIRVREALKMAKMKEIAEQEKIH